MAHSTDGHRGSEHAWTPPSDTNPDRVPSLRSRFSHRGRLVDHRTNRVIAFESGLERSVALLLMARNDIRSLREQWPTVEYRDAAGRVRSHTFDFLVTTAAGDRIAIAVKPSAEVDSSGLRETLRLIAGKTGTALADRFMIRTEEHVHPDDVVNARMIISARRLADPEADAVVARIVDSVRGNVVLGDLVKASGLEGRAFAALVRCIADGSLSLIDGGPIRDRSRVTR